MLRALRTAWLLIATDVGPMPKLGYAAPATFSHFNATDYWTLFALAREMGLTVSEVRDAVSPGVSSIDRIVLGMRRNAAYRLVEELAKLPPPVAAVVSAKARGEGWRAIARKSTGRVFFSLVEDLRDGCRRLAAECSPEIRELASK